MQERDNYLIRCHNIGVMPPIYKFKVLVTKEYIKTYAMLLREKYDIVIIAKVDRTI